MCVLCSVVLCNVVLYLLGCRGIVCVGDGVCVGELCRVGSVMCVLGGL